MPEISARDSTPSFWGTIYVPRSAVAFVISPYLVGHLGKMGTANNSTCSSMSGVALDSRGNGNCSRRGMGPFIFYLLIALLCCRKDR